MATYYGGPELKDAVTIDFSATSGDVYTCPAGRYAVVNFSLINALSRDFIVTKPDGVTAIIALTGATKNPIDDGGEVKIVLASGQKIKAGGGSITLVVVGVALEFADPA